MARGREGGTLSSLMRDFGVHSFPDGDLGSLASGHPTSLILLVPDFTFLLGSLPDQSQGS